MDLLSEIQVEYITMPGWKTSIKDVRTFSELPENAQKYIKKIEEIMRIPGMCTRNTVEHERTLVVSLTLFGSK